MRTTWIARYIVCTILALAFLAPGVSAKRENPPGDKAPLNLAGPFLEVTSNSVTITWNTNKEANSAISVTEIPIIFDVVIELDPTLTTKHRMTVRGLISGREYEYEIISIDALGRAVRATGRFFTP